MSGSPAHLLPGLRPYDEAMMDLALLEAAKARGRTRPNPLVGALVVDEEGGEAKILSTGYHQRAGTDHAEVAALRPLREAGAAQGKTLYVTLAPCNHVGRTGPCVDEILRAGIRRVVVGLDDPNPHVVGGGVARLRQQGLEVVVGVREAACAFQNRGYLRWILTGRPQMILKAALSLDGKLAPRSGAVQTGKPHFLTSPPALRVAHRLRDEVDAILVGAGTVASDNPSLNVRLPPEEIRSGPGPLRVVLDGALSISLDAQVVQPSATDKTLLLVSQAAATANAGKEKLAILADRGIDVALLPSTLGTQIEPSQVVDLLGQRQLLMVLCEGGSQIHGGFLSGGHYQEAAIFIAPVFLGEGAVPLLPRVELALGRWLREVSVTPLLPDVLIRGRIEGKV